MHWTSSWAIGAMSFAAVGSFMTLFVICVFIKHNDTPIVRASGRELSYVLLGGILSCYCMTFILVIKPADIVCIAQKYLIGISFSVMYGALLTKTNRIARIFRAGKRTITKPAFISPRSQLIICSLIVIVQILITVIWTILDPPGAIHHHPTRFDNFLICKGSISTSYMIAFTYPILLIIICTIYAILTRKIPEAFNESKYIGFTMYTTCIIWLAFVPIYFSTANDIALRITTMCVSISLSATVAICCLFAPKIYIILFHPVRNVRQPMKPQVKVNAVKSNASSYSAVKIDMATQSDGE